MNLAPSYPNVISVNIDYKKLIKILLEGHTMSEIDFREFQSEYTKGVEINFKGKVLFQYASQLHPSHVEPDYNKIYENTLSVLLNIVLEEQLTGKKW